MVWLMWSLDKQFFTFTLEQERAHGTGCGLHRFPSSVRSAWADTGGINVAFHAAEELRSKINIPQKAEEKF